MSEVPHGLEGVIAFETEIAEPDKEGSALRYRGVDIEEVRAREDLGRAAVMVLSYVAQAARGIGQPMVPQSEVDKGGSTRLTAASSRSPRRGSTRCRSCWRRTARPSAGTPLASGCCEPSPPRRGASEGAVLRGCGAGGSRGRR